MKRFLFIVFFAVFSTWTFAQEGVRVVDSIESLLPALQGREKVEAMMELSRAFFDFSFDDCVAWSEKAIRLSKDIGDKELEADVNYSLGIHYGYHSDLDLAQIFLKKAFELYQQAGNDAKAFEALWNQAYFELVLGNMDTAFSTFQEVMTMAEQRDDSLACAQTSANMAVIQYQ